MSFQAGAITGEIDIDESPTVRNFRNLEREAGTMKNKVQGEMDKAAKGAEKSWKDSLASIKGELGKGSVLGQGLKLAMGGGAIAGLGMAAHAVENFTESVAKMADRMRAGELTRWGMVGEATRAIPIFGSLVGAADNLREAMLGEAAAAEKSTAAFRKQEAQIDANLRKAGEYRNELKRGAEMATEWRNAMALELHPELAPKFEMQARKGMLDSQFAGISGPLGAAGGDGGLAAKNIGEQLAKKQAELDAAVQAKITAGAAREQEIRRLTSRGNPRWLVEKMGMVDEAAITDAQTKATQLEATLRSQVDALKAAKAAALGYADALGTSKQKFGFDLSKQGLSEFSKTAEWFQKQAKMVEDVASFKGSKADARAPSEKQFEALPNARTRGEEVFGRRTVTGADMGQAFAEKTEKVVQVIEKGNTQQQASFGELISAVKTAALTMVIDPP